MKHIDLFSGIGGFALAAERVWPEIEHEFWDNDDFCQAVLKKQWPNSRINGDVKQFVTDADSIGHVHRESKKLSTEKSHKAFSESIPSPEPPFILTGGFPCQPFSQAGRRKGTADDRYLWPAMLGAVRRFRPRWVVAENVAGLVTWNEGLVLETVCSDLEKEGYQVCPFIIPACAVQAPHRRDRIWIIGYTEKSSKHKERKIQDGKNTYSTRDDGNVTHFDDIRWKRQGLLQQGRFGPRGNSQENWKESPLKVASRLCRMDDGISERLDRNPRIKALGNAIVPQVAEEIFKAIREIEND